MDCHCPWVDLPSAVEPAANLKNTPAFPWMTILLALLAGLAMQFEPVARLFIYERGFIFGRQIWRMWTGHVVHFGLSHFIWNLAVFLPAGCWLERLWPKWTRWFYVVCPPVISLALLALDSSLIRYAGLSGLATGVLVLLASFQLGRRKDEPVWFWVSVLLLVAGKIGIELFTKAPLLVSGFGDIRTVPLAHIFGAACGAGFWMVARNRGKRGGLLAGGNS